ncbi:hypothetical protein FB566_3909 [Stackebrandtia endophytica]|uniref:Uncharacterized protein n=1 Tax=Stackebrandtia endophytica TaxID=1496996 RepID=A0A543B0K2_9ACTN|nr:hypothetical protein [Stackebrandtia endophytica]TQL78326.1 hypothetical protein FB566_3909 [Stackebrandtia endophytica]
MSTQLSHLDIHEVLSATAATSAGSIGRLAILLACVIAAVFVIRSLRMWWALISEVMSMVIHLGTVGLAALGLLFVVLLLLIGVV